MGDATSKLMRGLLEPLILDAIAREPKHGYALIRELEQAFGEPPNRNQVYPLLNRLEKEGFLRGDRSEGRGRTRYQLTGKGLELLKDYRLRTPLFRERVGALWIPEGPAMEAAAPARPGPAAVDAPPGPHLMEQLAIPDAEPAEAPPRARGGLGHAGAACSAEIVLRRRAGGQGFGVDVTGLDAACATCQSLLSELRRVRDAWF